MNSFAKLIEDGSFENYEARIYTKDRKVKWVQINSSLIYNEEGRIIAAQGIVRDITGAKANTSVFEEQPNTTGRHPPLALLIHCLISLSTLFFAGV